MQADTLRDFLTFSDLATLNAFCAPSKKAIHINGTSISLSAMIVATRFLKNPEHILVVAKDYKNAEAWVENLEGLLGENFVKFFPAIGLKPYEKKVPFEGILEERLKFFRDVENTTPFVTVCPLDSFLTKLPEPHSTMRNTLELKIGDVMEPSSLRPWLMDKGFVEQPVVSGVGEFSVRACIVDINCLLYKHPIRIEFFGDVIESIRMFDIFTQRSVESMKSVKLFAMGEFTVSEREVANLNGDISGLWWHRANYETLEYSLLDYLPNAALVFDELSLLSEMSAKINMSYLAAYKEVCSLDKFAASPERVLFKIGEFSQKFASRTSVDFTRVNVDDGNEICVQCKPQEYSSNGFDSLAKEIETFNANGGCVYVVASSAGALARIRQLFEGVPVAGYIEGNLPEGFWLDSDSIAFLTESCIFNRHSNKVRKRKISSSVSGALLIESLNRGDFVAHEDHGVARYLGLVRVNVNGGLVDCALLEYAGGDKLKFPVADLQKIERLNQSDEPPKLDKLGSKAWDSLKKRVKQKVIQIARDLVELYAKREMVKGFEFPPDGKLQQEFEDAFEYEPTPDQLKAISDIKRDMESSKPMDRLICGDVGFGKTEVAMRAAFKCVAGGKKVVLLVPTTILAAQHYENFVDRFAGFGVTIELVNRYKSAKEKREIFAKVAEGKVDILIGTHSLLSEKIQFNGLGLLIIDEEQKFGVKQKEKLREMRLAVDTLSMSATPIPRSLHLSMTGVRDISLINTPPVNRLPVETKLMKRDDLILKNAISDELMRGGQVFVVNDRVQTIYALASEIESLAPNATVGVAHGQMNDRDLENTMEAFLSRKFDILVSTSIIESGLDVPNANTIIIMNAHHFGISQLYQMRGRVGRSSVLAKAFLVIPSKNEISAESMRRLKALEQFTDLGSGYQLAMRDLEIRGAGNLLGQEQHGFIAEVGFETYVRLVREAVELLRGGSSEKQVQTRVEIGVDAYLPEDYIQDGLTRISMYQRIARILHIKDIENIMHELEDRFGPIPVPAKMLLIVTEIALIAGSLRIQGIVQRKGMLAATFVEFPPVSAKVISELYSKTVYPMRVIGTSQLQLVIELGKGTSIELAEKCLKEFRNFVGITA